MLLPGPDEEIIENIITPELVISPITVINTYPFIKMLESNYHTLTLQTFQFLLFKSVQ